MNHLAEGNMEEKELNIKPRASQYLNTKKVRITSKRDWGKNCQ